VLVAVDQGGHSSMALCGYCPGPALCRCPGLSSSSHGRLPSSRVALSSVVVIVV